MELLGHGVGCRWCTYTEKFSGELGAGSEWGVQGGGGDES